ncbi:hypothetical protein ABK040_012513 [Willaertia magna]
MNTHEKKQIGNLRIPSPTDAGVSSLLSPTTAVVEHSFMPNPLLFEQASQEFEQKQKRKISSGTLPEKRLIGSRSNASLTDLEAPTPTQLPPILVHSNHHQINGVSAPSSITTNATNLVGGSGNKSISPESSLFGNTSPPFGVDFANYSTSTMEHLENLQHLDDEYLLEQIENKQSCFAEEFINAETIEVCKYLFKAIEMRKKHQVGMEENHYPWDSLFNNQSSESDDFIGSVDEDSLIAVARGVDHQPYEVPPPFDPYNKEKLLEKVKSTPEDTIEMRNGIYFVELKETKEKLVPPVTFHEHYQNYKLLTRMVYEAPIKSFCYTRLTALELKFTLYKKLKQFEEIKTQKMIPHRDWYNVRKVDGHIHLSSMANQKHLLRFIKKKLKQNPNEQVIIRDDKVLTLKQVFESLNLTPYDLSVDTLDMHADKSQTMHRFDKFNLKYSPFGQSRLREIFLKTDNYVQGRYFGELCKKLYKELEDSRYQHAEPRISIYGKSADEWDKLAKWYLENQMYSPNIRLLVQIPRLYNIHKSVPNSGVNCFQDMLKNIFEPLFNATREPEKYADLNLLLQSIVGFDSVDDESKPEPRFHSKLPTPDRWNNYENPPYGYYSYYFYANIKVLNAYRKSKGLNTFSIRPHAGEAGSVGHLATAYLLADEINHGIELRKAPVLQYLYYLSQIGLAMSPLSNNSLFLSYEKNPFPAFFQRGLNVTLSTDDPLMFHFTREPLMEEYSIAAQVYHLSNVDLCEIARNSAIQSGFEDVYKKHWLGTTKRFGKNDIRQSNVPNLRIRYRYETLFDEHLYIMKSLVIGKLKERINRKSNNTVTVAGFTTAHSSGHSSNMLHELELPLTERQVLAFLYRDKPVYLTVSSLLDTVTNTGQKLLIQALPHNTTLNGSSTNQLTTIKEEEEKESSSSGVWNKLIGLIPLAVMVGTIVVVNTFKK